MTAVMAACPEFGEPLKGYGYWDDVGGELSRYYWECDVIRRNYCGGYWEWVRAQLGDWMNDE
jgi:hypothetical protein